MSALTFHMPLVSNLLLKRALFDLRSDIFCSSRLTSPENPCCVGRCTGVRSLLGEVLGCGSTGEPAWRAARHCDGGGSIEIVVRGDHVLVRRSTDPDGLHVILTRDEWQAFVGGVKDGDFDEI